MSIKESFLFFTACSRLG